jgi:formylglycine-generating enzyme required for sulfatase activity
LKRFPHARVLATCRAKQYPFNAQGQPSAAWKLPGFPAVTLADFDPEQIRAFVAHWFAELHDRGRLPDPAEKRDSLLAALDARPELGRDLAPKPILLTQMALVHAVKRLPDSRIDVYKECAGLLLWEWERLKARQSGRQGESAEDYVLTLNAPGLRLSEVEDALDHAVFEAHAAGDPDIAADRIRAALRQMLVDLYRLPKAEAAKAAETFIENWLRGRNGLLLPEGEESFNAPHRSFREFMAARYLRQNSLPNPDTGEDEDWKVSGPRLVKADPDKWREILRFAAGLASLPEVANALNELCPDAPSPNPADAQRLMLTGEIARDVGARNLSARSNKLGRQVYERLESQLIRLMQSDFPDDVAPPRARLDAGLLLDSLGWSPPDLYDFVAVSGQPSAISGQPSPATFLIAKYPVTNLQYQRFLDDEDNYRDPALWQSIAGFDENGQPHKDTGKAAWDWFQQANTEEKRKPGYWDDARLGRSHRLLPVVGVTWYEAAAYCVWLTRRWRDLPEANSLISSLQSPTSNLQFRLPLESEWLAAAGGVWTGKVEEDAPRYPWQKTPAQVAEDDIKKYANTGESGLGGTSPVCMYPAGTSPAQLFDMSGNVFEWQANRYRQGGETFALRGGAWNNDGGWAFKT